MYYVYHLIDPRCGSVFYVGKGKQSRISDHEREARAGVDHPKCDVIRAIWAAGLDVQRVRAREFADEQAAFDYEAQEVKRIGLANLTNLIAGGGGVRGEQPVTHEMCARKVLNIVARFIAMKAKGMRLSQPWHQVVEDVIPKMVRDIVAKRGKDFVLDEMRKYGIEADFAY